MVYMYYSFLIHSSADGHLGCFHVLAMINSAAMNTGVHVSLSDLVSLKIWNASRICMSSLRRGHANLLSIVPILVYVLLKRAQKNANSWSEPRPIERETVGCIQQTVFTRPLCDFDAR